MGGIANSADFSGDAMLRAGYPVDSNIDDNDRLHITVNPQYMAESEAGVTVNKTVRGYVGFDTVEDVSDIYSVGAEYFVAKSPFGVFMEHKRFDMKSGMPDYNLTWAGVTFRYNSK
ncbi:MAG TPA: hypothetical protein ENH65_04710 [Candidatus Aminicenantes bacterium]|nr:hypothetical protein [Candidatus Aminicenantes bacterium]